MDDWLTKLNIENFERRLRRCSNPAQQRVLRQLLEEERSKLARCNDDSEEGASTASTTGESATETS